MRSPHLSFLAILIIINISYLQGKNSLVIIFPGNAKDNLLLKFYFDYSFSEDKDIKYDIIIHQNDYDFWYQNFKGNINKKFMNFFIYGENSQSFISDLENFKGSSLFSYNQKFLRRVYKEFLDSNIVKELTNNNKQYGIIITDQPNFISILLRDKFKISSEMYLTMKPFPQYYFSKYLEYNPSHMPTYGSTLVNEMNFHQRFKNLFLHNANNAITESSEAMEEVRNTLNSRKYSAWGTDTLKKDIAKGDLDLAFVYTGDCLDMLYQQFSLGKTKDTVTFDIYIPDNTIAFLDSLVLTKKARHVDLAYKFMDFMLETENAKMNASVIGYCTPLLSTYNAIVGSTNEDEADWAYAVSKYYPLPKEGEKKYKGIPLTNFSKSYLTELTNMINNVKTK